MSAPVRPALLLGPLMPDALRARLAAHYDLLGPYDKPWREAVAALAPADAARVVVIVQWGTSRTTREVIDALPALRLVCAMGSGYDGIDVDAARERGVAVANSAGANASAVADLAIGLMIASVRGIARGDAYVRSGQWTRHLERQEGRGLTGRKVGIWGLGAIGAKIARRCDALEMTVGYHGRARRADVAYPYHATLVDLAAWADVLMVAVRAGPHNRHAVDARVLAALGPEGHVVNISRGSAIDEAALIAALRDGTIAGAALDVYEHEPNVPEALRALPNAVLSPHLGGDTADAQQAMRDAVAANVEAFVRHGAPVAPVEA